MTLDPQTKQHLTEARNRAVNHLCDPLMAFFAQELISDASPTDSLLGLISCVSVSIAATVKSLDLQREDSTNEDLADILADSFRASLLTALNACKRTPNHAVD